MFLKFAGECVGRTCVHTVDVLSQPLLTRTEGMNESRKSCVYILLKTEQVLSVLSLKELGYALGIQYALRKVVHDLAARLVQDLVSLGGLPQNSVLVMIQRRCNWKHSSVLVIRVVLGEKARTGQSVLESKGTNRRQLSFPTTRKRRKQFLGNM